MSAILNVKPFPSELTAYEIALDEWQENIRKWKSISGDRFNVSMKKAIFLDKAPSTVRIPLQMQSLDTFESMTVPTTVVTPPEKPEESETHGSDYFNSSVTYDVQTAMERCTLWPKTFFEWDEVWADPPEIAEAEVGAMLDNIDLDFDQSQTTSTKQKYMNCTNEIKSVNITTTAKTINHDIRPSE